jgi:hypothetical protein
VHLSTQRALADRFSSLVTSARVTSDSVQQARHTGQWAIRISCPPSPEAGRQIVDDAVIVVMLLVHGREQKLP